MGEIKIKENDFFNYTKDIIKKYFEVKEDRLDVMSDEKAPCLLIDFNLSHTKSEIMFIVGTSRYRHSVPERISSNYLLNFYEIKELIDFLLEDHLIMSNFHVNKTEFSTRFNINWNNDAIKGIYWDEVELEFNFNTDIDLKNNYIQKFIKNYYDIIVNLQSFNEFKNKYLNEEKKHYIDFASKEGILAMLDKMSLEELKSLLYMVDNDVFFKYIFDCKEDDNCKKLK